MEREVSPAGYPKGVATSYTKSKAILWDVPKALAELKPGVNGVLGLGLQEALANREEVD